MRPWLICLMMLLPAGQAAAQSMDQALLRGTSPFVPGAPRSFQWEGIYGGAQIGYTAMRANFGQSSNSLLHYILRNTAIEDQVANWTTLGSGVSTGTSFGGFVGINWQWDDAVLGFEANYNHMALAQQSSDALSRSLTNSTGAPTGHEYTYHLGVWSSASARLKDVGTIRARAGWAAGRFLPYAFGGLAIGRADVWQAASVSGHISDTYLQTVTTTDGSGALVTSSQTVTDTIPLGLSPRSLSATGTYVYGGAVGIGVEAALFPNTVLRGEIEYVQFAPVRGIKLGVSTFRTGVALKF